MFGDLTPQEIEEVLTQQIVGRIGTHADNVTYIVPVSYAYANPYVYVHSLPGMKVHMMRSNYVVCFQVDSIINMANWKSVVAWGNFEELKKNTDREEALRILLSRKLPVISSATTHLGKDFPFAPESAKEIDGIFFRIHLNRKTGKFEHDHVAADERGRWIPNAAANSSL